VIHSQPVMHWTATAVWKVWSLTVTTHICQMMMIRICGASSSLHL